MASKKNINPGSLEGVFSSFSFPPQKSEGSESLDMTSEGLGEMFEGDFALTYVNKFPLVLMGG